MSLQVWQGCLVLPSGGSVIVKYLNGLQVFGFCLAFFGLVSALLGLLDVVIIPAFHTVETHHYPIQPDLGNSYGLPVFSGVLTSSLLLVTRIFTAVNSGLTLVPCLAGLTLYSLPVLGIHCNSCGCCHTGGGWSRMTGVGQDGIASRFCCCCCRVVGSNHQPYADGEDDDSSLASHQADVAPFRL
ncbi:hypothetical protein EG68_04914 [Paragonimus skrjabini miyazakii]|uniref:Transmembrane protein n=1 Tax=Paragonimus skrjabini miyazakii TaxID=59628 RepID=A0A8S9Z4E2_9TREM|nr:hypothetical protein EG68_04914 [Paragonimus skrjabini miyazakii]